MAKRLDGLILCEALTHLSEAKLADGGKGLAEVCVIKPGFNVGGGRYYPADVLKRDHGIFEGVKMFSDHPTRAEEKARPEGSLNNWVGTLQDVRVDEAGLVHGSPKIHAPGFRELMSNLAEADCLSELGVSIRATGQVKEGEVEGRKTGVVESLDWAASVDFVTYPGAGGHAKLYESEEFNVGESTMTPEELARLVALEESVSKTAELVTDVAATMAKVSEAVAKLSEAPKDDMPPEVKDEPDPAVAEAQALLKDAQAKLAESEAKNKALVARGGIVEAIKGSKLPEPAQKRLIETHGDSGDLEAVKEAIESETEYLTALLPKDGSVHGLGESPEPDPAQISESDLNARISTETDRFISEGHAPGEAEKMARNQVGR